MGSCAATQLQLINRPAQRTLRVGASTAAVSHPGSPGLLLVCRDDLHVSGHLWRSSDLAQFPNLCGPVSGEGVIGSLSIVGQHFWLWPLRGTVIEVHVAAVSSCHEGFGVFDHPLVKHFLQGVERQCLVTAHHNERPWCPAPTSLVIMPLCCLFWPQIKEWVSCWPSHLTRLFFT